jgi:hypothetical protein
MALSGICAAEGGICKRAGTWQPGVAAAWLVSHRGEGAHETVHELGFLASNVGSVEHHLPSKTVKAASGSDAAR